MLLLKLFFFNVLQETVVQVERRDLPGIPVSEVYKVHPVSLVLMVLLVGKDPKDWRVNQEYQMDQGVKVAKEMLVIKVQQVFQVWFPVSTLKVFSLELKRLENRKKKTNKGLVRRDNDWQRFQKILFYITLILSIRNKTSLGMFSCCYDYEKYAIDESLLIAFSLCVKASSAKISLPF